MTIDSKDYRVPPDKKIDLGKWPTVVAPYANSTKKYKELLQEHMEKLSSLQQLHYASHRYALLLLIPFPLLSTWPNKPPIPIGWLNRGFRCTFRLVTESAISATARPGRNRDGAEGRGREAG
jgi:hypothetical protein